MVKCFPQIRFKLYLSTCFKHKFNSLNIYPPTHFQYVRDASDAFDDSLNYQICVQGKLESNKF